MMEEMTMSVREFAAQIGISLPKAYEHVKESSFPAIKVGTRILITVEAYNVNAITHKTQRYK